MSKKIVWPSCAFWLSVEAAGADAPNGLDVLPDGLDASLLDELPPPQAASIAKTEQIRARDSVRIAGIVFAGDSQFPGSPTGARGEAAGKMREIFNESAG
ncbi:hypothetical protein [Paraburkholderia aspalathi]|uniref:hypothetical protein n=1 Tax=Paraburkholderia aspalathi TaxID=1324617 RepID=UPI001F2C156E|nr:hypothetical protein [Paraburkholderia aspalathi]